MLSSTACPWCGRVVPALVDVRGIAMLVRHDNRNSSAFCKGSTMPIDDPSISGTSATPEETP